MPWRSPSASGPSMTAFVTCGIAMAARSPIRAANATTTTSARRYGLMYGRTRRRLRYRTDPPERRRLTLRRVPRSVARFPRSVPPMTAGRGRDASRKSACGSRTGCASTTSRWCRLGSRSTRSSRSSPRSSSWSRSMGSSPTSTTCRARCTTSPARSRPRSRRSSSRRSPGSPGPTPPALSITRGRGAR